MAKEHHCPNHGAQPCNAAGGTIHVCPICYTRWDELISEDKPAATPLAKPVPPVSSSPPPTSA
jgi:hypothetical protein